MTVTAFEQPEGLLGSGSDRNGVAVIEPHEHIEPFFHPVLLGDLNQQRRAQLTAPRHEGIVDIQFFLNFVGIEDMLDPDHFLGLKPQRLTIFEDKRDERSNGNSAPLLERDNLRAKLLPLLLILRRRQEVLGGQWVHSRSP